MLPLLSPARTDIAYPVRYLYWFWVFLFVYRPIVRVLVKGDHEQVYC